MTLEFSWQVFKNPQISNFIQIRPLGDELFYKDEQTHGHDKVIVAFRSFAKAPKTEKSLITWTDYLNR